MTMRLAETLLNETRLALRDRERAASIAERTAHLGQLAAEGARSARIAQFTAEHLDESIERVASDAHFSASFGRTESTTIWSRVTSSFHTWEDYTEAKDRYKSLRDEVADHFRDLGFTTNAVDLNDYERDEIVPELPNLSRETGFSVRLMLSWGSPE